MAVDGELIELRRNLASALAKEDEIITKINKLENSIKTEQFNDMRNPNLSTVNENYGAITKVHDVQNPKNSSTRSEFLDNIFTHVLDLDTVLSGVEFTAHHDVGSPKGTRYFFTIAAGQVKFFLQFLWLEQSKSVMHTQVEITSSMHKAELASVIRTLERRNNVHKIIRVVTEYSKKIIWREKILRELEEKYKPTFKRGISENEGYNFEISDDITGKKYFEATWTVTFFKQENKMDHSFAFHIHDEAEDLTNAQKEIFEMLTRGSGDSDERLNIQKLIGSLVRGFSKWLQE